MKDKPLYHTIAEKLAQQIDAGKYPPGSRLPAERELAEQFNVSRVTIREAEIALQAVGRIVIKTGSGVYVRETEDELNRTFPEISAFEVTEARALFESEAAALAAGRAPPPRHGPRGHDRAPPNRRMDGPRADDPRAAVIRGFDTRRASRA